MCRGKNDFDKYFHHCLFTFPQQNKIHPQFIHSKSQKIYTKKKFTHRNIEMPSLQVGEIKTKDTPRIIKKHLIKEENYLTEKILG